jgi:hypothetical protein
MAGGHMSESVMDNPTEELPWKLMFLYETVSTLNPIATIKS